MPVSLQEGRSATGRSVLIRASPLTPEATAAGWWLLSRDTGSRPPAIHGRDQPRRSSYTDYRFDAAPAPVGRLLGGSLSTSALSTPGAGAASAPPGGAASAPDGRRRRGTSTGDLPGRCSSRPRSPRSLVVVPSISELEGLRHSSNTWRSGHLRDHVGDTAPRTQRRQRRACCSFSIEAALTSGVRGSRQGCGCCLAGFVACLALRVSLTPALPFAHPMSET
jgi:hypothetical protein